MPRNGSGVYSAPAGTLATTLTTIKSPEYNAFVNDLVSDANAARPVVAGGTGGTSVTAAQSALSLDNKVVYASKSGSYTALATDNNAVHRYTATATVSLTAAATLSTNWHYTVVADGADITVDPNGSETINGQLTLSVPRGASATIVCDGSNFFLVMKPIGFELISDTGDFTGQSNIIFTNLAPFREVIVSGFVWPSSATQVGITLSTNNGSSFDTANNYLYDLINGSPSAVAPLSSTTAYYPVSGLVNVGANVLQGLSFSAHLKQFNVAQRTIGNVQAGFIDSGGSAGTSSGLLMHLTQAAQNALAVGGGATISGRITVAGLRG